LTHRISDIDGDDRLAGVEPGRHDIRPGHGGTTAADHPDCEQPQRTIGFEDGLPGTSMRSTSSSSIVTEPRVSKVDPGCWITYADGIQARAVVPITATSRRVQPVRMPRRAGRGSSSKKNATRRPCLAAH